MPAVLPSPGQYPPRRHVPSRQGAFISYARADGETTARQLHARLQADAPDIKAWLDRFEIEGGVGWWNQIERELDRAEFLLLVMTPAAIQSENTRNEWRSARQRGVCVYPVKGAPDAELDYSSLPKWMRKAHFYDPEAEWQKLIAHLRRGCQATRLPFMAPPLPAAYVPRPQETARLLDLLQTRDKNEPIPVTVALRGPGGFGKSTLAAAICHHDRTLDAFDDGVLWVTLGQSPNLLNELVKLYAALTGERPGFIDVEDAARELALKLHTKNCLIVIDDVWNTVHARPFLTGGAGCARLMTTRVFEVAADTARVDVEQMAPAEALQLLLVRADIDPSNVEPFRLLVSRLGQWPLAIKLAGSAMRQRIDRGDTALNALGYVGRVLDKRGISGLDQNQTAERADAVARTIGASLDLMTPDEQRRYAELTIFREGAAIPLAAAARLWQLDDIDTEDLARKLDDLALVEFDLRRGTLRMHAVLRSFVARRLADPPAVHRRMVEAWRDSYALPDTDSWRAFAYHMHHAGRGGELRALLLDLGWLEAKLRATDIQALLADFEFAGDDPVLALVQGALRLAAPALAVDPRQLRTQLLARLQTRRESEIVALCDSASRPAQRPWLRLMHPSLDAPGGMLLMTLVAHEREITALAFDQQERLLLSGSLDTTVRVWDPRDGRLIRQLEPHPLGTRAVAVSGDGALAIAGAADGRMYMWDVERGTGLGRSSREAGRAVTGVALSADGTVAVSSSRDRNIRVWNVAERTVRRLLEGHREAVTCVAISAAGQRAISGSDDCTVCVWDIDSGALERRLEGHTAAVNAIALSADGRYVLSGSSDRTVRLWDAEAGTCLHTLAGHAASVTAVALAASGGRAISGSSDRIAKIWNLQTGTVMAELEGHSDIVTAVAIDAEGTRAATGSVDRTIKIWRVDDLTAQRAVEPQTAAVFAVVFSPDARLCASGRDDGRITVRDVGSGRIVRTIDAHGGIVRSLAFTPDGRCVLSGADYLWLWMWMIDAPDSTWVPVRHGAPVDCYALSATCRYLTTSCGDRFVYLWDVPSGALVQRYGTRRLFDHLITPSPRRKELPDTDELRDTYLGGEPVYEIAAVLMTRDGGHAVFSAVRRESEGIRRSGPEPEPSGQRATVDKACILVLDTVTGEIQSIFASQTERIGAFAIDGRAARLLWARADHSLEFWNLREAERLTSMRGHTDKINAVALSHDGTRAFSCGRDRSLRVWSTETGKELAAFTADAALRALDVAPDGGTIAAADVAGRVHVLRVEFD